MNVPDTVYHHSVFDRFIVKCSWQQGGKGVFAEHCNILAQKSSFYSSHCYFCS